MNLTDISTIKTLCAAHGFSLSKEFGQNFIVNPGICPKIAEAAGLDERFGVLEVGPGVGVLTKELARRAKKVVAVEVDKRLPRRSSGTSSRACVWPYVQTCPIILPALSS